MGLILSAFTKTELDKLDFMYDGDKDRDAASKIRGFLFQDYVTIMCLLQDKVEYVCSEYLEDVDVFFKDGTFEYIQVKYYPKSDLKMKDISTDLYYQFLRLQMLHSNLKPIPSLYVHGKTEVKIPTLDQMKEYIGLENKLKKAVVYDDTKKSEIWLRNNVYTSNKKDTQKESLFTAMASEESLQEFVTKYHICDKSDINQYKKELLEALVKAYPNTDKSGKDENWQMILLGLAIIYIQQRYMSDKSCFNEIKVDKKDFDQYMKKSVEKESEQTIISYLVSIVCERYSEIIRYNDLSKLQMHMLYLIYQNTIKWINDIGKTEEGQYQLLNTFSIEEAYNVEKYRGAPVNNKLVSVAASKTGFLVFLGYLWKIMLNICQEKITDEKQIPASLELFDPVYYVVQDITDYVCLDFHEDKYAAHSVILPRAGSELSGIKRKIVGRMIKLPLKPEKWFLETCKLKPGKNFYNYSTANVNEEATVVDLGKEDFYIECMDCIKIDEGEWHEPETCSDCIFTEKCIKEQTL